MRSILPSICSNKPHTLYELSEIMAHLRYVASTYLQFEMYGNQGCSYNVKWQSDNFSCISNSVTSAFPSDNRKLIFIWLWEIIFYHDTWVYTVGVSIGQFGPFWGSKPNQTKPILLVFLNFISKPNRYVKKTKPNWYVKYGGSVCFRLSLLALLIVNSERAQINAELCGLGIEKQNDGTSSVIKIRSIQLDIAKTELQLLDSGKQQEEIKQFTLSMI